MYLLEKNESGTEFRVNVITRPKGALSMLPRMLCDLSKSVCPKGWRCQQIVRAIWFPTLDQHPRIYGINFGPCYPLATHLLSWEIIFHTFHLKGQGQAEGREILVYSSQIVTNWDSSYLISNPQLSIFHRLVPGQTYPNN